MSASLINGAQSGIQQDPLSCWWKIPNKNITVLLDMQVIDRINEDIRNAAVQGVSNTEIGGLLLGTITFDPALRVVATECFPVSCNHELGPSHRLSYADRMLLWKQVNRHKETWGEFQYFVSYYRSNLGSDFGLTSSDLALARDFVPDLFFFLLVQPSDPINIGGLFFSGETSAQKESRILFPFNKERLLSGDMILKDFPQGMMGASFEIEDEETSVEAPLNEMQDVGSYSAADFAPSLLRSLPTLENKRKTFRNPRLWISLAGLLVTVLCGYLYMRLKPSFPPSPQPEMEVAAALGLEATVEQNQLYIKWNKTFPGVQSAKKGILSLQNGTSTQTVNLNSQELLRGDIAVPYFGDQVSVQLLLVSEESTEIRPVATDANVPSTPYSEPLTEAPEIPSRTMAKEDQSRSQNPVVAVSQKPAGARQSPPEVTVRPRLQPKAPERVNNAVVNTLPTRATDTSQPAIAKASTVVPESKLKPQPIAVVESPGQPLPSSPSLEAPITRQPQITTFPSSVSSEAVAGASTRTPEPKPTPVIAGSANPVVPPIPSAKPKEEPEPPDAFIPPRPIEGLSPIVLPSSMRSQMPESMQIEVRVYVDASGAVIGAKSLYDNAQISRLAVDAIRRMRFTPARRDGQNVASDLIFKLKLATE